MTVAAIIQARMTSKRFPGKVMADLLGKPVLWHVLERAKKIPGAPKVVCAFPEDAESAPIAELCRELRVLAYAGSEDDVLGRYYDAARHVGASWIIRITADCPLIDPVLCGAVLAIAKSEDVDYASNVFPERTYPRGLDCEVFTATCLEAAHLSTDDPYDREHVTRWMQATGGVRRANVKSRVDFSRYNYCVDYPNDISRLEKIIRDMTS